MDEPIIPKHGGYRKLKSFQISRLTYDLTVDFVAQFIDRRSRTSDQMVQAARSTVQNIAEGSQASGTSKKSEMFLTGVARASIEELRLDYEDFLRMNGLPEWPRNDPRRQALIDRRPTSLADIHAWCDSTLSTPSTPSTPCTQPTQSTKSTKQELLANAALALINVAAVMLDRQIASLGETFKKEGGQTERLYRIRKAHRLGG